MTRLAYGRTTLFGAAVCLAVAFAITFFAPPPFRNWTGVPFALIGLGLLFRSQPSERTPRKQFWLAVAVSLIMVAAFLFVAGGWLSMFELLG